MEQLEGKEIWSMISASEETLQDDTKLNTPQFQCGGPCSNVCSPNITQQNNSGSDSFVVLSGSSMEEIEALSSLQDVQKKVLSIDFNSIISNLTQEEIEQKLVEVMRENSQLKETLLRNNNAMRKNFTSLVTWQNKVESTFNDYQIKFFNICEWVHQATKENNDLKTQISNDTSNLLNFEESSATAKWGHKMDIVKSQNQDSLSQQRLQPECTSLSNDKCDEEDKNEDLITNCEKMHSKIEDKIDGLQNDLDKLDLSSKLNKTETFDKDEIIQKVFHYRRKLETIIELYAYPERKRFREIQKNLVRCEQILSKIDITKAKNSEDMIMIQVAQYEIDKLRSQLLQEVIKYGDENKKLIEMQELHQHIFQDFCTLVNNFEKIEEDNFQMKTLDSTVKGKEIVLENLMKEYVEKMRILSLKEKEMAEKEATFNLNQSKMDKLQLETIEKDKILNERILQMTKEMEKLKDEKNLLDMQCHSYGMQCKDLTESMENTTKEFQTKMTEQREFNLANMQLVINDLREQLRKKTNECESAIVAVRVQLDYYRSDFEAEKKSKEELMKVNEALKMTIQRMQDAQATTSTASQRQQSNRPDYCVICSRYIVPGEKHGWNYCNMEFD